MSETEEGGGTPKGTVGGGGGTTADEAAAAVISMEQVERELRDQISHLLGSISAIS